LLIVILFKKKQLEELNDLKQPANMLPTTQLVLSTYGESQNCSVTKNNQQQLEFKNDTDFSNNG